MKHPATRRLYDYWDTLRGARPAPERSEVEPSQIRGILGDTFILEAVNSATYRYRLAGTRLCALHCRELKGRNLLRGWRDDDHEAVATLLAAVSEDAAAAILGVTGHTEREHTIAMEMLFLPLHVAGEGCSRILGSCAPLESPYWAGMHPILSQSVKSVRLLWPDERPVFLQGGSRNRGLPFDEVGLPGVIGAGRQVGHLTVFEGGKQ